MGQVETAYRKAIDEAADSGDASLAITLRLKLGRVLVEEVNQVDEALTVYRAVYDADSENADALAALERLYRATARFADLLGIYEKRRELSPDHAEKKADQATRSRSSTRRSSRISIAPSTRTTPCSRTSPPTSARSPRSMYLQATRKVGAVRRHPAPSHRARRLGAGAHRPQVSPRSDARKAHRRPRRRARELPGDPLPGRAARRRARGPRGAPRERGPASRGGEHPREHLRGARRLGEAAHRARHPERVARASRIGA